MFDVRCQIEDVKVRNIINLKSSISHPSGTPAIIAAGTPKNNRFK